MNIRVYKWAVAILACVLAFLAWRHFVLRGQVMSTAFIDYECKVTQESFQTYPLSSTRDPAFLAHDLKFLVWYYDAHSKGLAGSPLERMVRQEYEQTLTNVLAIFRRETTNDLGCDPRTWIEKYGK